MQNLSDVETDVLISMNGHNRSRVCQLERKGMLRTVKESEELKDRRALSRRLKKKIKERIQQLPLF